MAIHGGIPGIEVTVCVNKKALPEYNTDNDPSSHVNQAVRLHEQNCTVTSFIESVTGMAFTIMLRVKRPYHMDCQNLSFRTQVDGQVISKPLLRREHYSTRYWRDEVVGPVPKNPLYGPPTKTRALVFAEIASASHGFSQDEVEEHEAVMNPVGDIVVKVYRMSEGKSVDPIGSFFEQQFEVDKKYHEKALINEAKSHGITLGEELVYDPKCTFKVTELDGVDYPLAVFVFKYRCKKGLQDLGLIPKPKSNLNASLSASRINSCRLTIKRECATAECSSRPAKRQRVTKQIEIIDLTAEDDEDIVTNMKPRVFKHGSLHDLTSEDNDDDEIEIMKSPKTGRARCLIGGRANVVDMTWNDYPL